MDFDCCIRSRMTPHSYLQCLQDILVHKLEGYRNCEENKDYIYLDSEDFLIWISIDEEDNRHHMEDYEEMYGFKADLFLTIDTSGRPYLKSTDGVFSLFHEMIHERPEEFLCTDEHGNVILEKRNGRLSGYNSSWFGIIFPYDLLEADIDVTVDCNNKCLQVRRLEQLGGIKDGKITDVPLLSDVRYDYEYMFWIFTEISPQVFAAYLQDIITNRLGGDVKQKEEPEEIVVWSDFFIITVHLTEEYCLKMCKRILDFKANMILSIMVFRKTRQKGMEQLFTIFKDIIDHSSEEFIFGHFDHVILERRNNAITGHNPKEYPFTYPFRLLEVDMDVTDY